MDKETTAGTRLHASLLTNLSLSFLALGLFLAVGLNTTAQSIWDDGGGDDAWQTDENWQPDAEPTTSAIFGEGIPDAPGDPDPNGGDTDGETINFIANEAGLDLVELRDDADGDYIISGSGTEELSLSSSGALISNLDTDGPTNEGETLSLLNLDLASPDSTLRLQTAGIATDQGGDINVDEVSLFENDIVSDAAIGTNITIGGPVTVTPTFTQRFTVIGDGSTTVQGQMDHLGTTLVGNATGDTSDLILEGNASLVNTPQITVDGAGAGAELQIDNGGNSINDAAGVKLESANDSLVVNASETFDTLQLSAGSSANIAGGADLGLGVNGGTSILNGSVTVDGDLTTLSGTTQVNGGVSGTGNLRSSGGTTQVNSDVGGSVGLTVTGGKMQVNTALSTTGLANVENDGSLVLNATGALDSIGGGVRLLTSSGTSDSDTAKIVVGASEAIDNDTSVALNTANDLFDVNANETISALNTNDATATVDIASGATLSINVGGQTSTLTGNVVKMGDLEVLGGSATFSGGISGSGDLILSGTSTTTISSATTFTGPTEVNDGATLELTTPGALGGTSSVITGVNNNTSTAEVLIDANETINDNADVTLGSDGDVLDFDSEIETINALTTSAGTRVEIPSGSIFIINNDGGSSAVRGEVLESGALAVDGGSLLVDGPDGDIGGSVSLDLTGGTTTIDTDTTTTGFVEVENDAKLELNETNALGNIGTGNNLSTISAISDADVAEIEINAPDAVNDNTTITLGTEDDLLDVNANEEIAELDTDSLAEVNIDASATLTLSGNGSVVDGEVVKDGNLKTTGGTHVFNGTISGIGDLIVSGTGTTDLNTSNTFTGPVFVNDSGTLNLNDPDALQNVTEVTTGQNNGSGTAVINVNALSPFESNSSTNVSLTSENDVLDVNENAVINELNTDTNTTVELENNTLAINLKGGSSTLIGDVTGTTSGGDTGTLSVASGTVEVFGNLGGPMNLHVGGGDVAIKGPTTMTGTASVRNNGTLRLESPGALGGSGVSVETAALTSDSQTALIEINDAGDAINNSSSVTLRTANDVLRANADETIDQLNINDSSAELDIETGTTFAINDAGATSVLGGSVELDGTFESKGGFTGIQGGMSGPGDLLVSGGTTQVNSATTFTGTAEVRNNMTTLNANIQDALSGVSRVFTADNDSAEQIIRIGASGTAEDAINDSARVTLTSNNDRLDVNASDDIDRLTTASAGLQVNASTVEIAPGETLSVGADGGNSTIGGALEGSGTLRVLDGNTVYNGNGSPTFDGDVLVQDEARFQVETVTTSNWLGSTDVLLQTNMVSGSNHTAEIELNGQNSVHPGTAVDLRSKNDLFDVNEDNEIDEINTVADALISIESDSSGTDILTIAGPGPAETMSIDGGIDLQGDLLVGLGGSQDDVTVNGGIDGPGNITLNSGRLTINSDNDDSTYTGTTTLNSGTLEIGNNGALGTGRLEISGGVLTADPTDRTIDNKVDINDDFQIGESGAGTLTFDDDEPIDVDTTTATVTVFDVTGNDDADTIVDSALRAGSSEAIEKAGTGRLKLNADSSSAQQGDWIISSGTVEITDGNALGENTFNTIEVAMNGGTLDTNASGTPTLSHQFNVTSASTIDTSQSVRIDGGITGGSPLTKIGSGELILNNNNSLSGGIQVDDGDLEIENVGALGNASSTLTMNSPGNELEVATGNSSGFSILDNDIAAQSTFDWDLRSQISFDGSVTGSATINRIGFARFTIGGSSTGYSGTFNLQTSTTDLQSGVVFGDPTSVMNVNSGATLKGLGTVGGDLNVNGGGTFSPGFSPGIMSVDGDLNLNAGSETVIERQASVNDFLNSPGTGHDQVQVGQDINVNDSTAEIRLVDLSSSGFGTREVFYPDGASFQAFTVGGSITGSTPTITDDDDLVSWSLLSDGTLEASRTEYDSVTSGLTDNQQAVGDGLDALADATPAGAGSADQNFLLTLDNLAANNPAAYEAAIDSLSPRRYTAVPRMHRRATQSVLSKKTGYLADRRRGTNLGMNMASMQIQSPTRKMKQAEQMPVAHAQADPDRRTNGFVEGFYTSADDNSSGDRISYEGTSTGLVTGVDYEFSDEFLAGFSFAYADGDVDYGGMGGQVKPKTYRIGPYASWDPGNTMDPLHVEGSASFGHHDNHSERNTMNGTAEADFGAQDYALDVSAGYDLMNRRENTTVEPIAGLRYVYYDQESYTESGAGSANLSVDGQTSDSVEGRIGGRVAQKVEYGGWELVPSLTAAWRREFSGDDNENIDAKFTGANGGFEIERGDLEENAIELGTGLKTKLRENVSLYGSYTGLFYEDTDVHSFGAGVTVNF